MDNEHLTYADGLRALADLLDLNPGLADVADGRITLDVASDRDHWLALARQLGASEVEDLSVYVYATRRIGPLRASVAIPRDKLTERQARPPLDIDALLTEITATEAVPA